MPNISYTLTLRDGRSAKLRHEGSNPAEPKWIAVSGDPRAVPAELAAHQPCNAFELEKIARRFAAQSGAQIACDQDRFTVDGAVSEP